MVAIGCFKPSTRRCSACGELAEKFGLSVRRWQCAGCGTEHDRDINAAINIRELGLAQLVPGGTGELMRVEDGRPLGAAGQRRLIAQASVEARTGRPWHAGGNRVPGFSHGFQLRQTLPPAFVVENATGIDQMGAREQIAADLSIDGEYMVLPTVTRPNEHPNAVLNIP